MGGSRRRANASPPAPHPVGTGVAQLLADPDRPRAWTLVVQGTPQSHVDLDDATWLAFEYVRRIGHVIDLLAPPSAPLDAVHLGGGALTLARYVASTRPGSRQRVFEVDGPLVELVRRELPLPRGAAIRVGTADARDGLSRLRAATTDLVVSDVFSGARTPAHLTSQELVADAARVLRTGGLYVANVADGPPLVFARRQAATVTAVLPHLAVLAAPAVLKGRRFGNLVLVASDRPLSLPGLGRRVAGDAEPARVVEGDELSRLVGSARPVSDADALPSPEPPAGTFGP